MFFRNLFIVHLVFTTVYSTAQDKELFQVVSPSTSGISFKNQLVESPTSNVLTYEYFFNGGGVAVGDINNDGLDDIYFTSNMGKNKLYLNTGNMVFKDITAAAGVEAEEGWKTGVSMVDINHDGYLDIYVCHSGKGSPDKRRNKLFINNGNLTFSEKAKSFGLDDPSFTTQASFFDFDNDGDLDVYMLNHNVKVIREVEYAKAKVTRDPYAGDKFYRNDDGVFIDISEAAGIKGNPLGFGLGVTVSDINKDGHLDLYVSNDYVEPDYLYINNGNGTFTDKMTEYLQHISYFSMGCDISDFNNDGLPDIFTLDMLPEDNKRQKLLYGPENYEHYALMVMNGFYFQNMRNMLHLNNGDGTFSEIGQLAGVSSTDWSWSPLFADYDNDGLKDLFVTNGYFRDYTNRDFLKFKGDYYFEKVKAKEKADTFHLVSTMTSTPLHNYIYKNNGDLTFTDKSSVWGFKDLNFSNGAAYSDFDNDGDLDLIINNQNETASLYRNRSREIYPDRNYVQVSLRSQNNVVAQGAKVDIYTGGMHQFFEQLTTRGFQSSVSSRITTGVGTATKIDSLKVTWLSGAVTMLTDVPINKLAEISEPEAGQRAMTPSNTVAPAFVKVDPVLDYQHMEEGYNDFKRQPLLLSMLTTCGPVLAAGDVNGDGKSDVFVGGAQGTPGKLFIQNNGAFLESPLIKFERNFNDAGATFIDSDKDGDLDLYVVSGGYNEYKENDPLLQDRLYLNEGAGKFVRSKDALPAMLSSKSCVAAEDFDKDGDVDLFVGGRVIPGRYPESPSSFLLLNNGGTFEDVFAGYMQKNKTLGMVTDAHWSDVNADGWKDLIVAGEFMPIEIFINEEGKRFRNATAKYFDRPLNGMWNKLVVHDFDKDGDEDIMAGNLGLNTQLRASEKEALVLVYKDFDKNGSVDPVLNYYIQGKLYPFPSRDEMLDQIYGLRSKFRTYEAYSSAQLQQIFSPAELKDAKTLKATILETIYLENTGEGFRTRVLPKEAQFSPVYTMEVIDYNNDGHDDLIVAGNQSSIRIRIGVIDANFGLILEGDGKGNFKAVPRAQSGLRLVGDVKDLQSLSIGEEKLLLIGINNMPVESYRLK